VGVGGLGGALPTKDFTPSVVWAQLPQRSACPSAFMPFGFLSLNQAVLSMNSPRYESPHVQHPVGMSRALHSRHSPRGRTNVRANSMRRATQWL
jgi:hypothetical protein